MDQRREFVRLAMQEGANRRELCRRFGIHPDTGYKWLSALAAERGRCRPVAAAAFEPGATDRDDRGADCGGARRASGLGRAQDRALSRARGLEPPAVSTVHRDPAPARPHQPPPGGARGLSALREAGAQPVVADGLQGLDPARQWCALPSFDDGGRSFALRCRASRPAPTSSDDTVRGHLETTFRRYGLPEAFFVDNGSPWGDASGQALDPLPRLAAQARRRASSTAGPIIRRAAARTNASTARSRPKCSRSGASAISPRCSAPSTPGARSTISSGRMKHSTRRSRQPLSAEPTRHARTPAGTSNTTATRSCAPSPQPRPTSASRAGSGRCPQAFRGERLAIRPTVTTTASTASSSPPTRSLPST